MTNELHNFSLHEPCPKCLERTTDLERMLGYVFQNKALLLKALTHSSYAHENPRASLRRRQAGRTLTSNTSARPFSTTNRT